ncbi:hypothetical protein RH915_05735 [Serpentinicella sp. ANB-PHB4]|uniref:hypothetical protein n=1 Tax=Serpentinicella sp. ANB-PHB4 TaxID=3074076 RepID=UPI00285802A6|nr:hypothetical protein [Serpentinicella sp. ANB-PHB4]MDR5658983.1 hypothetical protein [Serpentinicella sp. ANB-PHB4]
MIDKIIITLSKFQAYQWVILFFAGLLVIFFFNIIHNAILSRKKTNIYKKIEITNDHMTDFEIDKLINKKMIEFIKPDKLFWEIDEIFKVKLNDKISFNSNIYGFIQGYFLGLKSNDKNKKFLLIRVSNNQSRKKRGDILSIPLEMIDIQTLNIW